MCASCGRRDDRYVIANAGDELRRRLRARRRRAGWFATTPVGDGCEGRRFQHDVL